MLFNILLQRVNVEEKGNVVIFNCTLVLYVGQHFLTCFYISHKRESKGKTAKFQIVLPTNGEVWNIKLYFKMSSHTQECQTKMTKTDKDRSKGKGRRFYLGTEFIQFLGAPAILHQDDFEEWDKFILFSKSSWCKASYSSNRRYDFEE